MKLASFDGPAGRRVGIVDGEEIVDLTAADPSLATMTDLLQRGPQAASGNSSSAPRLPLSSVKLAAPVPRPPKFLAIGYNNPQHLEETNTPRPTRQVWFNKQQSCIVGPGDGVWIPRIAPDEVDYEGELGMVIGRRCKRSRLASARARDGGEQVLRHSRPDRSVDRDPRRDRRPHGPGSAYLRQRRPPTGWTQLQT